MSKPQATPDAELVMPWETADERESVETAEESLFELLGSDPEFEEKGSRKKGRPANEDSEHPENEDGSQSEEDEEDLDLDDDFEDHDPEEQEGDDDLEEEYEDGEEEEAEEEDVGDDLHVVKVDGEEIEVTYDELVSGYSRTEYLTRTRQKESAEHREAMQGVETARAEYAEKLELMAQALDQLDPGEPDWEKIQRENPNDFGAIFAAHQKRVKVREAVAAEKAAEAKKSAEALAQQQSDYVAEQFELLTQAVPEWRKDQKAMAADIGAIREFAQTTLGFSEQEVDSINDHRVILALRAAKTGFELEQGGRKALRNKRRRGRTLRPSGEKRGRTRKTGGRRSSSGKRIASASRRVARTGNVTDAASLFETMLEDGADL